MGVNFLGFDFGASGGRAMLGRLEDGRLEIEELHRFSNDPVRLCGRLVWDLPRLVIEMKRALTLAGQRGLILDGIGIDAWGVDFGLLDGKGRLLGLPVHYRDERTDGMMERAFEKVPRRELFARTGTAFNKFNTVFQLLAMREEGDSTLDDARHLLFMPDLLAYCLTGSMGTEFTVASTAQLLRAGTNQWDRELFERLGLPADIMGEVTLPGALRGVLSEDIARECGVPRIPVYAVAGHDTASAVAAAPLKEDGCAYLSSGTWSLLGVETDVPILTDAVLGAGYTNEGGADGRVRLLKNIMGLWILQECRREWARRGRNVDFGELAEAAAQEPPFTAIIDVDDPAFLPPGDMPERVREWCRATGQAVPDTPARIARVVCEGLALKYRQAVEQLERDILGRPVPALTIVGGGSKNRLLNRLTADALNRPVVAGPAEATVIGNLLMQARAVGAIGDGAELRRVVEQSFPVETFLPEAPGAWDDVYARFLKLTERG